MKNVSKAFYWIFVLAGIWLYFILSDVTAYAEDYGLSSEDQWVEGEISENNTADRYTITLPSDGWLTASVQGGSIYTLVCAVKSEDEAETFWEYRMSGSTPDSPVTGYNTMALKAGNYKITVNRFASYGSGLEYTYGTYKLKYSFKPADNSETEPNNSFEEAMPLPAGEKVTGFLALNDTEDFYQFELTSKKKIKITCTTMMYSWVRILDDNRQQIAELRGDYGTGESNPKVLEYEAELKPGVYYIRPSCGTNFNSDYGRYIIQWKRSSSANDVKERAKELHSSMDKYIKALRKEAAADKDNYKADTRTKGSYFREADETGNERFITFFDDSGLSDDVIDSVYEALAKYLDSTVEFDIGKISVSSDADIQKYAKQMIDSVGNNIRENSGYKPFVTKSGTVVFNIIGFSEAFSGTVKLGTKEIGEINCKRKATEAVMIRYLENLSDTADDLMYQTLSAVFKDLTKVTGISDFVTEDVSELLKGAEKKLRDAGYGRLMKYLAAVKDGYELNCMITDTLNEEELINVLEDADKIWKELDSLDYSDSTVDKVLLKEAMERLNSSKEALAKALYAYFTDGDSGEVSWIAKKIKKLGIHCPVDVVIYDSSNQVLGSVKNGRASFTPEITILVNGDTKTVWLPENLDARLELTGTGNGTMCYTMQEIQDDVVTGQVNYYDVPLREGLTYRQNISGGPLTEESNRTPLSSWSTSISADDYFSADADPVYVDIWCEASQGGTVSGVGTYTKGDTVCVTAEADEGYYFAGWFADGEFVEADENYYFAAVKDMELRAYFEKKTICDTAYGGKAQTGVEGDLDVYVAKGDGGHNSIILNKIDKRESITVLLKKYPSVSSKPVEETVVFMRKGNYRYILEDVSLSPYVKVELYDEENKLAGTVWNVQSMPSGPTGPDGNTNNSTQTDKNAGTVSVRVSRITIAGLSKNIAAGKKVTLKAGVFPANASNKGVRWKSSNTKVATVNAKGVVSVKKKTGGKSVTITAEAMDGSGKKAVYKIKSMKGVVRKIKITGRQRVQAGKSLRLKGKVTASKGANRKLRWISSNKKYASVSSSGKVKTYKAGKKKKVRITAMATDGSGKKQSLTIMIR